MPAHILLATSTVLTPRITARLRVLNVHTDSTSLELSRTIITTVRLTSPVVLSIQFHIDNLPLWTQLAILARRPNSRLRYLDVLLDGSSYLVQNWLDQCLPLLADSGLLCMHLKFVTSADNFYDDEGPIPSRGWGNSGFPLWRDLRDRASTILMQAIPGLRYAFVSTG